MPVTVDAYLKKKYEDKFQINSHRYMISVWLTKECLTVSESYT